MVGSTHTSVTEGRIMGVDHLTMDARRRIYVCMGTGSCTYNNNNKIRVQKNRCAVWLLSLLSVRRCIEAVADADVAFARSQRRNATGVGFYKYFIYERNEYRYESITDPNGKARQPTSNLRMPNVRTAR